MAKCKSHYTKKELNEIMKLLPTYTEEEKQEIVILLIDLAKIYLNSNLFSN